MNVVVAYATPEQQIELTLEVSPHCTIAWVVRQSGLLQRFPELALETLQVGVFGRRASLDTVVKPGDRVEIYRPLVVDPKEARRRRLAK